MLEVKNNSKIIEKQKLNLYLDEKMLIEGKDYFVKYGLNKIEINYSKALIKTLKEGKYFHFGYNYSYSSNKINKKKLNKR